MERPKKTAVVAAVAKSTPKKKENPVPPKIRQAQDEDGLILSINISQEQMREAVEAMLRGEMPSISVRELETVDLVSDDGIIARCFLPTTAKLSNGTALKKR